MSSRGDRPVAPTEELIRASIKGLALRDFEPEKKVIEYALANQGLGTRN